MSVNHDVRAICRLLALAAVVCWCLGGALGCARPAATPMAEPGQPTDPGVARFVERMAEEQAKQRLAAAWRAQGWPGNHAAWDGRVLRFGKGIGQPRRMDFSAIDAIVVRPAFKPHDREYEVVITGRLTPETPEPPMMILRTDRWTEARDLAAAAKRLSGADVISELDRTNAPPINPQP